MRYSTVLFDLDHTLLDSDASHAAAYEETLRLVPGIDDPWTVFPIFDEINQALWRRVESGELHPDQVAVMRFEQLLTRLGRSSDPHRMSEVFRTTLGESGELYPGVLDLLGRLSETSSMALVTNGIGSVQRRRIDRLEIERFFDAVIISGEVGVSKPGRAIFDLTFQTIGPELRTDAVMVGDNLGSDVRGGRDAGLATIWFNPDGRDRGDGPTPTAEARSIDELSRLLGASV